MFIWLYHQNCLIRKGDNSAVWLLNLRRHSAENPALLFTGHNVVLPSAARRHRRGPPPLLPPAASDRWAHCTAPQTRERSEDQCGWNKTVTWAKTRERFWNWEPVPLVLEAASVTQTSLLRSDRTGQHMFMFSNMAASHSEPGSDFSPGCWPMTKYGRNQDSNLVCACLSVSSSSPTPLFRSVSQPVCTLPLFSGSNLHFWHHKWAMLYPRLCSIFLQGSQHPPSRPPSFSWMLSVFVPSHFVCVFFCLSLQLPVPSTFSSFLNPNPSLSPNLLCIRAPEFTPS